MWISSINSTLEVESAGKLGTGWFFRGGDGRIRRGRKGAEGRGRRVREYSLG